MLTADNDFIKSWVEQHYLEIIKQALNDLFHVPFNVILAVDAASAAPAVAPSNPQTTTREPQSAPASPATMPPSAAVAPAHEYSPTIVSAFPSGDQSQIARPQPEQERRSTLDDHFESSLVEHSAEEQPHPRPLTNARRGLPPSLSRTSSSATPTEWLTRWLSMSRKLPARCTSIRFSSMARAGWGKHTFCALFKTISTRRDRS